ncbi:hypothetical protein UCDDS831_g05585 [Diplodia seriata]|uniref:Uncharacterized protein n=1 Tax=Diplodia seriata TaxID=420778 RepID=A0A0G2GQR7_9PEZI|nr:hypothetical protein UCDDS831_g05585 [Diplodia seriata]
MANEEESSLSLPHPPQNRNRYSGSRVDSELYYHNPFYYRTHRDRTSQFKGGDNISRGFRFNTEALKGANILYEDVDESVVTESDIPQFQIPDTPISPIARLDHLEPTKAF